MATRFVLEGTWSGYKSSQSRVVHRTVHSLPAWKKLRAWAESTHCLPFSDGTVLYLSVREALPREKVEVVNGYTTKIMDAYYDSAILAA